MSKPNRIPKSNISKKALIPLLLLTTFVVVVKLKFEHYNLLFPLVPICVLVIILKKYNPSRDYRVYFWLMLIINFSCLAFPDTTLYKLRKNYRYFWSEKPLDLSHFRVLKKTDKGDTTAVVCPIIVGKISKVYNFPSAILFTSDYIGCSWIDTTGYDGSKESERILESILEHEKRHLDIMEIYTRKAQDSIDKMIFYSYSEKYQVFDYYFGVSDSIQDVFDFDTEHGTIEEKNSEWNRLIEQELKKPRR